MAKKRAKLNIRGVGPGGNKINVWIVYNKKTGEWEVRKKKETAPAEPPIGGAPPCSVDDIILDGLAAKNPCWVKIGGRWYKIC